MEDRILIVFEGVKTEPNYFKALAKIYFPNFSDHVICAFENNIYDLWNEIKKDPDLDIVEVIRERNNDNRKALKGIRRSEISQTYLFFDLDGHDIKYEKNKIFEVLKLFSDETGPGSIFISYPMVEALRHFVSENDFYTKKVDLLYGKKYKNLVHTEVCKEYSQLAKVSERDFHILVRHHILKSNHIVSTEDFNKFDASLPNFSYIEQTDIFDAQLKKFIELDSTVAVLSAFPLFLYQYFGGSFFANIQSSVENNTSS